MHRLCWTYGKTGKGDPNRHKRIKEGPPGQPQDLHRKAPSSNTNRGRLPCAWCAKKVPSSDPHSGFLAHLHLPHVNRRGAAHQTEDQVCARRVPPMPPGATHTARASDVRTHHTPVVCWCIGASNGFSGALAPPTGQSAGCSAPDREPGVR